MSEKEGVESTNNVNESYQVTCAFNQVFIDLIKDVKSKDKSLSHTIKKHYNVLDRKSSEYITEWNTNVSAHSELWFSLDENQILENETVRGIEVIRGLTVGDIVLSIDVSEHNVLKRYLFTLFLLSHVLFTVLENKDNTDSMLAKQILMVVAGLGDADTVSDPQTRSILDKLVRLKSQQEETSSSTAEEESNGPNTATGGLPPNAFFEDSKIGQLAKEITSKIDMSSFENQKPEDLMNIQNMFNGSNTAITNIIQQVGSTITEKIQKGELRQEDLVADAMSLMSKMNLNGNNNGMAGMMKNMMSMLGNMQKGGGSSRRKEREDVRTRLKKKMEARRGIEDVSEKPFTE